MKKHHNRLLLITALCLALCTACTAENGLSDQMSETSSRAIAENSTQQTPNGIWRVSKFTQHFPFANVKTYTYGENGLLLQTVTVYGEGGREETTVFSYDADQNLLSEITTDQNGTEIAFVKQTFADGKLMSKTVLELGASREKTTLYSYDANGRLKKTEPSDGTGATENYTYHEGGGYTVEWVSASGSGSYLYDASGNLLETRHQDGELNEENIYDAYNRLLATKHYFAGEVTSAYQYEYDAGGNLLKRDYYSYGELQQTMLYEYDEYGNQIKIKQLYNGNEQIVCEMEYELFGTNE